MFRLSLGKIPVRIHFNFFLMALILGAGGGNDVRLAVMYLGVIFLSVLLHELGHALTGMAFGLEPEIDLHGMGGTTSWTRRVAISAPKRIAISLAGPMVGIVIGGTLLYLARTGAVRFTATSADVANAIIYVNLGWGLFNLAPILPLDGGNVMAHFFALVTGGGGRKAAHVISIVFASLGLVFAVLTRNLWIGFLAGMFAVQNFRALAPARPPPTAPGDGPNAGPPAGLPRW